MYYMENISTKKEFYHGISHKFIIFLNERICSANLGFIQKAALNGLKSYARISHPNSKLFRFFFEKEILNIKYFIEENNI